ncbi:MAG: gliding motility-associated C-terminal domain-containing protein [Flavobacteriales bacterium]|nr:gliding motility-associated C-terminal domain-containing protein [Flavobacteriales bacterium]
MRNIFLICLLLIFTTAWAQRGKDGDKIIATQKVVNAYTFLTADASAGDTSITVNSSALNSNFSGNITSGDLIMIIQVQGVSIIDMAHPNQTPDWGRITNYNNCGNYEFVQVESVPNGTTINFDCGLINNYTASGNVIIVRVPRYNTLTINPGGILTTTQWDGTSGGILAVEVLGTTIINAPGKIDVSELGFRGGVAYDPPTDISGSDRYADDDRTEGAEKGEGIAGDQTNYVNNFEGKFNRGAAANAGGGANAHNAGGGGGANAGNPSIWNNGVGNPDISNANYIQAWNMENSITGLNATTVSSGGGRGGYSFLQEDEDELNLPPGHPDWGSSKREAVGGLGGRPLDYSTGRIFMGGAGGAGEGNDNQAGDGGNAGGLIFLKTYDGISGDGDIASNGQDGGNSFGNASWGQLAGKDGAGGAGAGGTIILQTTSTVSLTGQIVASGGNGGNQILTAGAFATKDEGEGPGGSGGGGYISISAGTPTMVVTPGINGVTDAPFVSNFPPNGATNGGSGISETGVITAFDITSSDTAICPNTSVDLTATIIGTAPIGATIEWYDAEFNGNLLQTGANYSTPLLSSNTTYYVKTCPGDFSLAVNVTMDACGVPPASSFSSSDSTLCLSDCISFNDLSTNSPTSWTWYFFGSDSLTSTQQNPTNICYNSTGYFPVALVSTNGSGSDSLYIDSFIVVTKPIVIANATDTTICSGDSIILFGSGSPVNNYSWLPSITDSIIFSPTTTQLYTVTGTDSNLCTTTDTITVHVLPLVTPTFTQLGPYCVGDTPDVLPTTSNNGVAGSWDAAISTAATGTTTYTFTPSGSGCATTATMDVDVSSSITPTFTQLGPYCIGDTPDVLPTTSNNGVAGSWDAAISTAATGTTTYTFTPSGSGCATTATMDVDVSSSITPTFTQLGPYCVGDTPDVLPTTSNNGVAGSWDAAISTAATGTTTYTFTPSGSGCATTATMDVDVSSSITPTFTQLGPYCIGDTPDVLPTTSNNGVAGSWDAAISTAATGTTTYTFTPSGSGCATTATMDVDVSSSITPTFTQLGPYCIGDTPDVLPTTSNNGVAGSWDAAISTAATGTTTYTFTPSGSGCATTATMDVDVSSSITPTFTQLGPYCIGDTPDVLPTTSNNGVAGSWDAAISTAATGTTTYTFTPSGSGCATTATMDVDVSSSITPTFTQLGPYCVGDTPDVLPTTSNNGVAGSWDAAISTAATGTTTYTFTPSGSGCATTATMDVSISICSQPNIAIEPVVIIPSVFTPNIDGHNDQFNISGVGITVLHIKIFNRWGELIFETNQLNEGWNGRTTSGTEVPEGTYFYIATVTTTNGEESHHGSITLIR